MGLSEKRVFAVLFVAAVVLISRGPNSMSGDAPHYLAVSHSIVHDLDLDLTNQYRADGDYLFRPDDSGGHVRLGREGRRYPFHYPGLSFLMTPFFFVAEGVSGLVPAELLKRVRWDRSRFCRDLLSLVMATFFAWTGVLSLRCCRHLLPEGSPSELGSLQAFLAPPLLSMSILVFTEVPAALLCVLFVLDSLERRSSPLRRLLALSLLPWLHLRYAVISVAGFGWMLAETLQRHPSGWKRIASLLWIPLLSFGLLSATNWWMFGNALLWAQYETGFPLVTENAVDGLLGQIADRDFGLLSVAPFWIIALSVLVRPAGLGPGYVLFARAAVAGTWIGGALNPMWWGGYSPPARFLVPVLPILVPALAEGYRRLLGSGRRWMVIAAVAYSVAMTTTLLLRPMRLWSDPEKGLGILASLTPLHHSLPSFYMDLRPGLGFAFMALFAVALSVPVLRFKRAP